MAKNKLCIMDKRNDNNNDMRSNDRHIQKVCIYKMDTRQTYGGKNMKKIMIDIEATMNGHLIVITHHPKASGIIGTLTPKQEPDKRSFETTKEFLKWIEQEIGHL